MFSRNVKNKFPLIWLYISEDWRSEKNLSMLGYVIHKTRHSLYISSCYVSVCAFQPYSSSKKLKNFIIFYDAYTHVEYAMLTQCFKVCNNKMAEVVTNLDDRSASYSKLLKGNVKTCRTYCRNCNVARLLAEMVLMGAENSIEM